MSSQKLAQEYAESMLEQIEENVANGLPFGISEDGEEIDGYDYLQDMLDFYWIIDSERRYSGAKLLAGYGGPNVWINTQTRELTVYWDQTIVRRLPDEFVEALDEILIELWESA
jgi:hypothetical protein